MSDSIIETLDGDDKIIQFNFQGFLTWPSVRFYIIQSIIDLENGLNSSNGEKKRQSLIKKITVLVKVFTNFPFFGPEKPLLIFNTSTSNVLTSDGQYFNRIVDYFHENNGNKSWIIEESNWTEQINNRKYKAYSRFSLDIVLNLIVRFTFWFRRRQVNLAGEQAEELVQIIDKAFPHLNIREKDPAIVFNIQKRLLKFKPTYNLYKCLFVLKKTKKIIIEDGYYGLEKACIIKAAKDCNIIVAEPQHGFVNDNHPAYSYGKKVIAHPTFKNYQPDVFLAYGEFWANNIKIPNKICIIGNPHLETSAYKIKDVKEKKKILIIGSGVTIGETNLLMQTLLDVSPINYKIYYRPHPQERNDIENRYGKNFKAGIIVDNEELYFSMAESEIIVSELSTVIFEAVALNKSIFLYNSSYTQAYYNENIKYFEKFDLTNVQGLFSKNRPDPNAYEYYWKSNWKKAYLENFCI